MGKLHATLCLALVAGCTSATALPSDAGGATPEHDAGEDAALAEPIDAGMPWRQGAVLEAEEQAPGDPERGEEILLNGSYMSCGIPLKLWVFPVAGTVIQSYLGTEGEVGLPGRTGRNAMLPHTLNAFTTSDGAEVINRNCLMCHSSRFDGELV